MRWLYEFGESYLVKKQDVYGRIDKHVVADRRVLFFRWQDHRCCSLKLLPLTSGA